MKYAAQDVKQLGTIVCVFAHPDDESWYTAGLLKAAVDNGQRVVMVTATKGDSGRSVDEDRWPIEDLAYIREEEMYICLDYMGALEHRWLDYDDGTLAEADSVIAAERIASVIDEIGADTVLTFEPGGITGHVDHRAVYSWTEQAVKMSKTRCKLLCAYESAEKYENAGKQLNKKFNIYFNCAEPNTLIESQADVWIELDEDLIETKMNCLRSHQSQTSHLFTTQEDRDLMHTMACCEVYSYVR